MNAADRLTALINELKECLGMLHDTQNSYNLSDLEEDVILIVNGNEAACTEEGIEL